jgi:hypothetical protein
VGGSPGVGSRFAVARSVASSPPLAASPSVSPERGRAIAYDRGVGWASRSCAAQFGRNYIFNTKNAKNAKNAEDQIGFVQSFFLRRYAPRYGSKLRRSNRF